MEGVEGGAVAAVSEASIIFRSGRQTVKARLEVADVKAWVYNTSTIPPGRWPSRGSVRVGEINPGLAMVRSKPPHDVCASKRNTPRLAPKAWTRFRLPECHGLLVVIILRLGGPKRRRHVQHQARDRSAPYPVSLYYNSQYCKTQIISSQIKNSYSAAVVCLVVEIFLSCLYLPSSTYLRHTHPHGGAIIT